MKDLGKNVIEIKFVGPDTIEITRTVGSNEDYTTLQHSYCEQENFSKETVQECLGHFLDTWERKMFKPRLENGFGECYGVIGTLTDIVDINGEQLRVGDVVALYDVAYKIKRFSGVCEDTNKKSRYEIMGCFGSKWERGFSKKDFFIIKEASFDQKKHNEECCTLIYKLKKD